MQQATPTGQLGVRHWARIGWLQNATRNLRDVSGPHTRFQDCITARAT
jgi:hypothetical protein